MFVLPNGQFSSLTSLPSSSAMEATIINQIQIPKNPNRRFSRPPLNFPRFIRASSSTSQEPKIYKGPKPNTNLVADFVSRNDDSVRSLPIYVGGASLLAVLFNRAVSGIAPVADASRAWESLKAATCCKSLVIVYSGICLMQIGMAAESAEDKKAVIVNTDKLMKGSVYKGVMKSKAQSYLANLSLYPGRSELPFLPANTQAVILQPLGDKGIAVIGGNTIRGFTSSDQAWISSIGEKLDATLGRDFTDSAEISQEADQK